MTKAQLPSNLSYVVLVHGGSYQNFLDKLKSYPKLKIRYEKTIAIHYHIIQIEDEEEKTTPKQVIYNLPLMAMREEFSNYVFFKNVKSYNSVLKRMCGADDNDEAAYDFLQHMMTPFEKSRILKLEDAKSLKIEEENEAHKILSTSYYNTMLKSEEVLNKIFELKDFIVDDEDMNMSELIQQENWKIGIHR